jgi:hypothetical protein
VPENDTQRNTTGLAVDRATAIRDYVEQIISVLGEHPECELKRDWPRNTPFHKAELVKDIQATANSAITPGKEKYIVVGADQQTRTITGCNPVDYDDASIRQLLEQYLDPVPDFEVLSLKSSANADFVVLRFPYQENRPIYAKGQIRGERNQLYLDVGQVWIKPGGVDTGSTGKRLVSSRHELLGLINVEPRVSHEVELRLQQLLPQIRLEERTRLSTGENMILPVLTATDEEFESYVEQLLVGEKANHLSVALEKLRDRTVLCWATHFDERGRITAEQIAHVKETEFLPAIKRLTLLGLLLIKFSAPLQWFSAVIDLLLEVFDASQKLRRAQSPAPDENAVSSLDQHQSYTVPALEALLAIYLLAAYALVTRGKHQYLRSLFPRVVNSVGGPFDNDYRSFLLFWPLTFYWGTPNIRRDLLVVARYARGDRIEELMEGGVRLKAAVLQVDCLCDWHSVLAQEPPEGQPEIHEFFERNYVGVNNWFEQNFTKESLTNISPLVNKLWEMTTAGTDDLFFAPAIGKIVAAYEVEKRREILARFLMYAERTFRQRMWNEQRMPFPVHCQPNELNVLLKSLQRPE